MIAPKLQDNYRLDVFFHSIQRLNARGRPDFTRIRLVKAHCCHNGTVIIPAEQAITNMHPQNHEQCIVPANDLLFQNYHDTEWAVPVKSDQVFFEKLCLEGFQSGLSWRTVLHRRNYLRQSFDDFDPQRITRYTKRDINRIMADPKCIRNHRKILSVINNARCLLTMWDKNQSLAALCWQYEPENSTRPDRITLKWLSANTCTAESAALAKNLKSLGWSYVGPTNVYAMMQALGIVNDHVSTCPRHRAIDSLRKDFVRPAQGAPHPG